MTEEEIKKYLKDNLSLDYRFNHHRQVGTLVLKIANEEISQITIST